MSKPEHTRKPDALADGVSDAGPAPAEPPRPAVPAQKSGVRSGADAGAKPGTEAGKSGPDAAAEPAEAPAEAGAPAGSAAGATGTGAPAPAKGDAESAAPEREAGSAAPKRGGVPLAKPRAAVGAKSEVAAPESEAAGTKSGAAGTKPGVPQTASDAAGSRPEAAAPKTADAGAKPEVAKTKSEAGGGTRGGGTAAPRGGGASAAAGVRAREARERGEGDLEGSLLAGRYRLGRVLGKGGMGTVWRAVDETLGRTVAIKELRFSSGVDEDEKRRLVTRTLREAKAIARIRSDGAVTVFDVVDDDGRPWIVMELIEGASLAEVIREKGPLTPRRAAEVGLAVLDVLRAAHSQGILHRDVKPSNVLIADTGRVVLTDFGIAQVEGDPSVTSTGMLVGAPSYISPERARGQKPGPPADMWSLGGLLYAATEGTPPYDKGSALATLTAVMTEPVDPPKNAGPLLTDVIYGLLDKDPATRLDDPGARTLLNAVIDMPEPEPEPPADETRVIALPPVPEQLRTPAAPVLPATPKQPLFKPRTKNKPQNKPQTKPEPRPKAAPVASPDPGPRRPVAAPLTDVMSRQTIALAIVAVIAVLALIGGVIAWAVSGDDEPTGGQSKGTGHSAGPTPARSAGGSAPGTTGGTEPGGATGATGDGSATGSQDGSKDGAKDGSQDGSKDGSKGGSQGGDGTGGALPAGYATVTDARFHFSMALPADFSRNAVAGRNSGGIYNRDGGYPRVQVDYNKNPTDDAKLAWAELAMAVRAQSNGYKQLGLKVMNYRNYPTTADWEFERTEHGVRMRVLNRGFKVDATHGYAIMITCPSAEWDGAECTTLRDTAFGTFKPLD
ncbi:protein kinase [Streptomyces sp. NPDC089919]|uniref:protein kinase domain-containing protein n=1 Tax=Streptomyces sp. NPDC089919 TaxID=3155188 RepID=UPI00341ABB7E